ncbi:MAG: glycosyltransferase [Candidatus Hydrogenedentes bacterium]|nr:glycosyltransferase [Candidatus Hydrogenedentota bacterium]
MKILHVYKDFDPPVHGGMERHLALMCKLQSETEEVEALTCSRSRHTRSIVRDGITVTEVGEWGRFQGAPISPRFPHYLKRAEADVIVIHTPNPTAEIAWRLARPRAKLIVRYQSDVVRQATAMRLYGATFRSFLNRADRILVASERYLQTSPYLQSVKERCQVIPLGILPGDFAEPEENAVVGLRETYGGRFVLFAGRHRYYKGLDILLNAAPAIRASVVIAGDGPERAHLQRLASSIDASIFLPGTLTHRELVNHLHACAVFVLPSVERSEAFGVAILEAHACGKPVVATRLGTGVEYANMDGVTGINVEPRDPDALANAINSLLDDRDRAIALGHAGRERVWRDFDARKVAEAELTVYREALSCK